MELHKEENMVLTVLKSKLLFSIAIVDSDENMLVLVVMEFNNKLFVIFSVFRE